MTENEREKTRLLEALMSSTAWLNEFAMKGDLDRVEQELRNRERILADLKRFDQLEPADPKLNEVWMNEIAQVMRVDEKIRSQMSKQRTQLGKEIHYVHQVQSHWRGSTGKGDRFNSQG